jgi:hypothetical protein
MMGNGLELLPTPDSVLFAVIEKGSGKLTIGQDNIDLTAPANQYAW